MKLFLSVCWFWLFLYLCACPCSTCICIPVYSCTWVTDLRGKPLFSDLIWSRKLRAAVLRRWWWRWFKYNPNQFPFGLQAVLTFTMLNIEHTQFAARTLTATENLRCIKSIRCSASSSTGVLNSHICLLRLQSGALAGAPGSTSNWKDATFITGTCTVFRVQYVPVLYVLSTTERFWPPVQMTELATFLYDSGHIHCAVRGVASTVGNTGSL